MFALAELSLKLVSRRRSIFFLVNFLLLSLSTAWMSTLLVDGGWTFLSIAELILFALLQIPLVFGFCLAATGFCILLRGGDPVRITNTTSPNAPATKLAATAIVMPIFNEDVGRVFQGLKVIYESLQKTGLSDDFDLVVLSDSNDPNYWIAEERAWLNLCKFCHGFGRILYRKRRVSLHNKSGNIADFCRRWGARYRYMIVLDADSIMTGPTLVKLVQLMELNRRVGIIQTNPQAMGGKSLFQRIIQFSSRIYGTPFTAGMNFWQLNSGNYWGHNAIIRLEPFMKYCAMPELPKNSSLGTRILSHDTVEATFMRRAGYDVWFAYDLGGSYEELPPNLLTWLQRDQRWCFGNLQHIWLVFARRIRAANRVHIINGILGYISSPLWLLFLLLGTLSGITASPQKQFDHGPVSYAMRAEILFAYVAVLLLLPKFLGVLLLLRSPAKVKKFGGSLKIMLSVGTEIIYSMLVAPIQMLFYTRFVVASLTGTKITWDRQKREAGELPPWGALISAHLGDMLFVLLWAAALVWWKPSHLAWMSLIFIGPLIAIPLTRLTASESLGLLARARGFFLTPEETNPPPELRELETSFLPTPTPFFQSKEYAPEYGLLQAILDPYLNSAHVSLLHQRPRVSIRMHAYMGGLCERLLLDGPFSLTAREKRLLLWDADSMQLAHFKLWSSPASHLHEWWQAAFRHYNETSALSLRRSIAV